MGGAELTRIPQLGIRPQGRRCKKATGLSGAAGATAVAKFCTLLSGDAKVATAVFGLTGVAAAIAHNFGLRPVFSLKNCD